MIVGIEFQCGNEECEYRYRDRQAPDGNVYRLEGEEPPLVYRVLAVCESVPTEMAAKMPNPAVLFSVCPRCGHWAIRAPYTDALAKAVKLPIKPTWPEHFAKPTDAIAEGQSRREKPREFNDRGFNMN